MLRLLILLVLLPWSAQAGPPRVVADIPPVHSLAAMVMQGVADPVLLLEPGTSPHGAALRPAQAQALARADLVIWMGPDLTPWLDRALGTLGEDAAVMSLLAVPGTRSLRYGEAGHDDHDHGGGTDPHAWLDPANARAWLAAIADALARADPANAATYQANAGRARATVAELEAEISAMLAPARGAAFIVYHDALRYFEAAFGVEAIAVIAEGDAARPGVARLVQIREILAAHRGACVLLEPQIPARAVEMVIQGTGARLAVIDLLGADVAPGAELYGKVLTGIARAIRGCAD